MADSIPNRGPELLGVNIAFLATAIIAALLRCYVRIRMVKAWGLDDWLMVFAAACFTIYCASSITGIHYGTGRHHADLAPTDIQEAKKNWWRCYLFYSITMISSKLSIGWFLLRIAIRPIHRMVIYGSCLFTAVTGLVFFFVTVFQCSPVSYFWDQYEGQEGHCINIDIVIALAFVYSAINVIVDFSFALLPAFLVWGLQLDRRTKIATIPLLAMGCVASGGVVARLAYLMNLRDPDFLWATLDIAIWSTVEQGLAITAGSLAALRPLMKRVMSRFGWSRPSEVRYGGTGTNAGSRRKGSFGGSKVFNRSHIELITSPTIASTGPDVEAEIKQDKVSPAYPPSYATGKAACAKSGSTSRKDSQEELWHDEGSSESLREAVAGVVVTKSWHITVGNTGN